MSKSLFTIRGFKPFSEQNFDATGIVEKFATFETRTVPSQHEAVIELLAGPIGVSARTLSLLNGSSIGVKTLVDARPDQSVAIDEVLVINLTLVCNIDKDQLKDMRPKLVESFTRWAEKSRVRGSRGWRTSAIRTPVFEKNEDGGYFMKAQILLSSVIFYDQDTIKIGTNAATVHKDFENLKRHVNSVTGNVCKTLKYDHSVIGKGTI